MFIINGNQTEFTQWEQGYSLTNPNMKAGDAVQFFSGAGDGSIMTAKEEGGVVLVEVPNIMLKHASNITARFVNGGDYTSFAVVGRKRPKGYVFIDNEYKEKEPTGGGGGNSTYNAEFDFGINIPPRTFQNNTYLTKASFPTVEYVQELVFDGCTSLETVDFPNIISIDEDAFLGCVALTEVNFPKIKSIGAGAFNGCSNLAKVELFNDIREVDTYIGGAAFHGCENLKSLIIRTVTMCNIEISAIVGSNIVTMEGMPTGEGFIYVPSDSYESYVADFIPKIIQLAISFGMPMDEATATYIATMILRKLEDYTVDGTTTGELDESKI